MKLLRYGPSGREKPGVLDAPGRIRDLPSGVYLQPRDKIRLDITGLGEQRQRVIPLSLQDAA